MLSLNCLFIVLRLGCVQGSSGITEGIDGGLDGVLITLHLLHSRFGQKRGFRQRTVGPIVDLLSPFLSLTLCPLGTAVSSQLQIGRGDLLLGKLLVQLRAALQSGIQLSLKLHYFQRVDLRLLGVHQLGIQLFQLGVVLLIEKFNIIHHIFPVKTPKLGTETLYCHGCGLLACCWIFLQYTTILPGKQLFFRRKGKREEEFFGKTLYKKGKVCYNSLAIRYAPVAQWIEHRIPVPRVGGSSPFRRTK